MIDPYFIGVEQGYGAQIYECFKGPQALLDAMLIPSADFSIISLQNQPQFNPSKYHHRLEKIVNINKALSEHVYDVMRKGFYPIVLGGDHSIANGTWNGVKNSLEEFSLLWIDAHADSHTQWTSPSSAIHGMPLASLLGYGESALTHLTSFHPVLKPQDVCLWGTRSYEKEEIELLKQLGVRIYFEEEVIERGIEETLLEAIDSLKGNGNPLGVSFDLDVFSSDSLSGFGSPEPGFLHVDHSFPIVESILSQQEFCCFELVEYNPQLDHNKKTLQVAQAIVEAVMPVSCLNAKAQ